MSFRQARLGLTLNTTTKSRLDAAEREYTELNASLHMVSRVQRRLYRDRMAVLNEEITALRRELKAKKENEKGTMTC